MQPHKKEDIHKLTNLLCLLDTLITHYHKTEFEDGQIQYHRDRVGLELLRRLYCGVNIIINKGGFPEDELYMIKSYHPQMYKVYNEEIKNKKKGFVITAEEPTKPNS